MQDDQPRPDLDAAIDAVVPSITAVGDDAAADSLRRTRVALAASTSAPRRAPAWSWGVAAVTAAVLVIATALLWQRAAPPPDRVALATRPAARSSAPAPAPVPPTHLTAPPAPTTSAAATRRAAASRRVPVTTTSTPLAEPVRRPDPLIALVRAVQAIPEDAWTRGTATPVVAADDVVIRPIAIAPLETPAITDAPAEPIAPGEP